MRSSGTCGCRSPAVVGDGPHVDEAVKHRQAAVADSRLIGLEPAMPAAIFGE
jgi:hypothetical protein